MCNSHKAGEVRGEMMFSTGGDPHHPNGFMTRTIPISLMTREWGERTVQIKPHWAGKGIAIHKSVTIDDDGHPAFRQVQGYWRLTHIPTGMGLGACMGSLDRAKGFARAWDAEFAALKPGQAMAPDRLEAWKQTTTEMSIEPPRKPSKPRVRRGAVIAQQGA
jgi:hypothetical protein